MLLVPEGVLLGQEAPETMPTDHNALHLLFRAHHFPPDFVNVEDELIERERRRFAAPAVPTMAKRDKLKAVLCEGVVGSEVFKVVTCWNPWLERLLACN